MHFFVLITAIFIVWQSAAAQFDHLRINETTTLQKIAFAAGTLGYLGYLGYKYYACKKTVDNNNQLIAVHAGHAVPVPSYIAKLVKESDLEQLEKKPHSGYKFKSERGKIMVSSHVIYPNKFLGGVFIETQNDLRHPFVIKNTYETLAQKDMPPQPSKSPSQEQDGSSSDSSVSTYGPPQASLSSSRLKINGWKAAILVQASVGLGYLCQRCVCWMGK